MPTMRFPGKYESLPAIGDFIKKIARQAGFNEDNIYEVELAVDEACTNIIEHAYQNTNRGDIICSCHEMEEGLKIIIKDEGRVFDPSQVPDVDPTVPLDEVSPRGAGIFLMRRMMDEIRFEFDPENGNVLTMIKRYPAET